MAHTRSVLMSLVMIFAALTAPAEGTQKPLSPAEAKTLSEKLPVIRNNIEKMKKDRDDLAEKYSPWMKTEHFERLNGNINKALTSCKDGNKLAQETIDYKGLQTCLADIKAAQITIIQTAGEFKGLDASERLGIEAKTEGKARGLFFRGGTNQKK